MHYVGTELELFARAANWKRYLGRRILPHLSGRVLEVGAGNGANTAQFLPLSRGVSSWTCLEPDSRLAAEVTARGLHLPGGRAVEVRNATSEGLAPAEKFDSILYVDVLEHIEDDGGELARVAAHLEPGGRLVIMSPAHQFLFSPFDASVGHFRRYDRRTLLGAIPPGVKLVELRYLDSFGLLASLAQRGLLKQKMPTVKQIMVWDRFLVPVSRVLDPLSAFRVGKSLLGVWQKA